MPIKFTPHDFQVHELLAAEVTARLSAAGTHAVYRLAKSGLNTTEAMTEMARKLSVRTDDLNCAGLKDRHARTVQHISVRSPAPLPVRLEGGQWSAELVGWLDGPLDSKAIAANRFRMAVRGLSPTQVERMVAAAERLALGAMLPRRLRKHGPAEEDMLPQTARKHGTLRFVNYFGDQRFGSARHGRGFAARALIDGDFEKALRLTIATVSPADTGRDKRFKQALRAGWGRWREVLGDLPRCPEHRAVEVLAAGRGFRAAFLALPRITLQMCLQAYQSNLWNRFAGRLIQRRCPAERLWTVEGVYGQMVFVPAGDVPAELLATKLPLLGPHTRLRGAWREDVLGTLAEDGLKLADLHVPGAPELAFRAAPRPLLAEATNFTLVETAPAGGQGPEQKEGKTATLEFDLPRGAYATVLLRALGQ